MEIMEKQRHYFVYERVNPLFMNGHPQKEKKNKNSNKWTSHYIHNKIEKLYNQLYVVSITKLDWVIRVRGREFS